MGELFELCLTAPSELLYFDKVRKGVIMVTDFIPTELSSIKCTNDEKTPFIVNSNFLVQSTKI